MRTKCPYCHGIVKNDERRCPFCFAGLEPEEPKEPKEPEPETEEEKPIRASRRKLRS